MSGRKGSVYEREFVKLVMEAGLPARRVPLSGAMQGYDDDVVVCDEFRIECKYRKQATGFRRLHDWLGTADALELPESNLLVYSMPYWLELVRASVDEVIPLAAVTTTKSVTPQQGLLDWLGVAHYLAVRRPHHPWLVMKQTYRIGQHVFADVAGEIRRHKITGTYTRAGRDYLVLDHSWEVSTAAVRRAA